MPLRVVFAAVILLPALRAGDLSICWQDRVGMDPVTWTALTRELEALVAQSESTGSIRAGCAASSLAITVRYDAPRGYERALGLAYRDASRIQPRIELYWNPTLRQLGGARARNLVGRALARVAAHELAHYVRQQSQHDDEGLLAESFTPQELASPLESSFLLKRR